MSEISGMIVGQDRPHPEGKPEAWDERFFSWVSVRRKALAWSAVLALLVWLAFTVKEVSSLLLLSYALAVLLDPLIRRFERLGVSRGASIIGIGLVVFLLCLLLLITAVPIIVSEYTDLIAALPEYLHSLSVRLNNIAVSRFNVSLESRLKELVSDLRDYVRALGWDQIKAALRALASTVLRGYSFTLTVFNLLLLPFFVFYIARDLETFHKLVSGFLPAHARSKVGEVCKEVLDHIYAFFRGQLTVSMIMAALYATGLVLIGMPSGFVVGVLAGVLNIVPYLGLALGLSLSLIITLVTDSSWMQLALVGGVFVIVQGLEGMFLTPKIVGESVGLHPLGVMVALIIGGQLLGLVGIIIAVPAAASIRVLFRHLLAAIDRPTLVELTDGG